MTNRANITIRGTDEIADEADDAAPTDVVITGIDISLADMAGVVLKFYLASCLITFIFGSLIFACGLGTIALLGLSGVHFPLPGAGN